LIPAARTNLQEKCGVRRSVPKLTYRHAKLLALKQQIHPETSSNAPETVTAQVRAGDLLATLDHVPNTITSVCAIPTPKRTLASLIRQRAGKVEVPCTAIAPTDTVVVMEIPPIPRFE
jgi:hypothetical protein